MKKLVILSIALFTAFTTYANGPKYASDKTKEVIGKMIEAHGGYERWSQLKTLSFTTVMHSASLPTLHFWINDQVIDMKTRRTYQDWPVVQSKMSYDGEKAWSVDWRVGNPPNHQHSVFFYYMNLPWLTQDDGVILGESQLVDHKAFDNKVYKVHMSYEKSPVLGKSAKDTYDLYIDSKTYQLVGYEYTVGYGPLLDIMGIPKSKEVFGPVFRKNAYFVDYDGLKFAALFSTHSADLTQQYGDHVIYSVELDAPFDESRMKMPKNAVIDTGKDVRK